MRHIRTSEVIDRNAPELVDLFDHLRDTLPGGTASPRRATCTLRHQPRGLRLKVSASPSLRPLAVDFVENRRHELLYDLADRLRRPEPTRFATAAARRRTFPNRCGPPGRNMRRRCAGSSAKAGGTALRCRPSGPADARGLFLINAPLEQPLASAYITDVRRDLQDFPPGLLSRRPFGRSTAPAGDRGARPSARLRSRTSD